MDNSLDDYFRPYILEKIINLFSACAVYYYITQLEKIKCLSKPSLKTTYIKFYALFMIILIILSLISDDIYEYLEDFLQKIIIIPLFGFIFSLYTYVIKVEKEIKSCPLTKNMEYLHEYIKLYSLYHAIKILEYIHNLN